MGSLLHSLTSHLSNFIREQPVFFVASSAAASRVNLSPKGTDSLRVLDEKTVAYLDMTRSGNETAAHVMNDGRLTMMFCSFGEKPLIVRVYGQAEVVQPGDAKWNELIGRFTPAAGVRQIVALHIDSVQTSCGFGVPRMQFVAHREELAKWVSRKSDAELNEYRLKNNSRSIDGLPVRLNGSPPTA